MGIIWNVLPGRGAQKGKESDDGVRAGFAAGDLLQAAQVVSEMLISASAVRNAWWPVNSTL
ncbi:hypothetical protein LNP26_27090 [Klebsiella variicola subsp. variicola]|nr:hypothetical protein [Klebsiella variicola subsp. variicola]